MDEKDPWYYVRAKEFGNWYKVNPGFAALTMLIGFVLGRIFH
jgi:hypothetical protein